MRIKVSNYRNILSGELELQDNKLNFIVGPCGSGKSAFIDAVSKPLENTDITVNHSADDVKISVDGKDPQECSIKAFTSVQQGVMFEEAPNANGYRIFVGDDIKLQEQIEKFEKDHVAQHYFEVLRTLISKKSVFAQQVGLKEVAN
ncbi:MAG: AAA family ATPase, partial [Atopobium sp.]|nr:AAA family ATPase [Atopobium sp.]